MIGYREDDFSSYVFSSEDYGKTWISLKNSLPEEGCNVIREDPVCEDIVYLGTDLTVYVSLDRGKTWHSLRGNLPTQAVYDMKIHPRENELIIVTHGRGVFVLPLKKIQELTPQVLEKKLYFLEPDEVNLPFRRRGEEAAEELEARFLIYSRDGGTGKLMIKNSAGKVLKEMAVELKAGLNEITWDLRAEGLKERAGPGEYQVEVALGQETQTRKLKLLASRMQYMRFEVD
jgi:hypothetical protein